MRNRLFLALAAVLATACVATNHHDGAGGIIPNVSSTTLFRIMSGSPSVLTPGSQAGYAITATQTQGASGATYQVVWTGDSGVSNTYHEFWGTIWTTGAFSGLDLGCDGNCPLESDDYVSGITNDAGGGQRVNWDTFATDGLDGFYVVTDTEPVILDFYIDGGHYENLVFFPSTDANGQISSVTTFPFALTTN